MRVDVRVAVSVVEDCFAVVAGFVEGCAFATCRSAAAAVLPSACDFRVAVSFSTEGDDRVVVPVIEDCFAVVAEGWAFAAAVALPSACDFRVAVSFSTEGDDRVVVPVIEDCFAVVAEGFVEGWAFAAAVALPSAYDFRVAAT
jgi:virulence-associated protein VagC